MNLSAIDSKITLKIQKMSLIVDHINNEIELYNNIDFINELTILYTTVNELYYIELSGIIENYKKCEINGPKEKMREYSTQYYNILNIHNINSKFAEFESLLQTNIVKKTSDGNFLLLISEFNNIKTNINNNYVDSNICCGMKMELDELKSQYSCVKCGLCQNITNTVFDERYVYSLNGNYSKSIFYQHARTLKEWIENILCRVNFELIATDKQLIENEIRNRGYYVGNRALKLTIEIVRQILKKLNMQKYNSKATKIMTLFTGIEPPLLTNEDIEFLKNNYFDIINESIINTKIKALMPKKNKPYCPFFVYKIVQTYWSDDKEKIEILKFIHLQEEDTVKKMDQIWFEYCAAKKIKYIRINFAVKRNFE